MNVTIRQLAKSFADTAALQGVSLEINSRELFFLLGPSGCGKTTLLRTLAGFYQPDSGELLFGGKSMGGVPAHERNTGMVFQNYALWPHLSVAQNVAYGLEVRGMKPADRNAKVRAALESVQMLAFQDRSPNQLSGGQQQRVALARALVIEPDVLLLDEPLSNLDAKLRLEMREEIRRIHESHRITTVYVTHDQKEALALADRIAVLRQGKIEQVGTPREIYRSPANRFVADFIGETNWLSGRIVQAGAKSGWVETSLGRLEYEVQQNQPATGSVWVGFRPEAVEIGSSTVNAFRATIEKRNYLGEVEQYVLLSSTGLRVKAVEQNPRQVREAGGELELFVRPENLLVLPESV